MKKVPLKTLEELKESVKKLKGKQGKTSIIKSQLPASFKICTEIFSGILAGLIVGRILDHIFNTQIIFTIVSLILGCISSFMVLYRMMTKR